MLRVQPKNILSVFTLHIILLSICGHLLLIHAKPRSSTIKETTETNIMNVSLASDLNTDLRKQTNFIPDLLNKTSEFSNVSSTWLLNNSSSNSTQSSSTEYLKTKKPAPNQNNQTNTGDTTIIGTLVNVNVNIVVGAGAAIGGVSIIISVIYCVCKKC